MKRQTALTLGIDTNKIFEREIQLSAFRSIQDFKKNKNLFINLRQNSDRERWITYLEESLKTLKNIRKGEAIQKRYNRSNNQYVTKKNPLSRSQIITSENVLQAQNIRRRSCACNECGKLSSKVQNLTQKVSRSYIQFNLSQSNNKKKGSKSKVSMKRLASKVDSSVKRQQTINTLILKSKYGEIALLPEKMIETYLKLVQKCRVKVIKGSKDDIELKSKYLLDDFQERKSLSQLDRIIKEQQQKEAELKKQVRYSEESDSDDLSRSPSIFKKSTKFVPTIEQQTMKNQVENQKQKREIVINNVLQRNRLTANKTINKFLVLSNSAREIPANKNIIINQKKAFQFISLNSLHYQSQKCFKTEVGKAISITRPKVNSASSHHIARLKTLIKSSTSQSSRKIFHKQFYQDQIKLNQFNDHISQGSNRLTISQQSGRSKLEEIYKQFTIRNVPSSSQKQRKQK